jgi:hypothetical protein
MMNIILSTISLKSPSPKTNEHDVDLDHQYQQIVADIGSLTQFRWVRAKLNPQRLPTVFLRISLRVALLGADGEPMTQAGGPGNAPASLLAALVNSSEDAIVSKTLDGIVKSWKILLKNSD